MQKHIARRADQLGCAQFSSSVHPLLQRLYSARHCFNDSDVCTDLSALLSPQDLQGIDAAVSLVVTQLRRNGRMLIVGDFDADGATSCALAVSALTAMGAVHVDFLVPNRFEFGYGLTPEIVAVARARNPDLIITVDNGISSIDGVAAARESGIEVLVTDHHLPGATLPNANAIINPNQPGCGFASKSLAGVGVIFYLMTALRTALREAGWFEQYQIAEPNMADFLDLVALGTVADVVPLDRNNRILVQQGLKRLRAGRMRPGIQALLDIAGRQSHNLVSGDLGFAVGPRLNAAGRLDDMSLGIRCLLTDDPHMARQLAIQLDELNRDRKTIESGMQQEAFRSLAQLSLDNEEGLPWGLCLYDKHWHQGVIGILASRVKDQYHRPVIAFADQDDGCTIKGSARSIPGLHIRDALDAVAAQHPQLLSKFGGHAMAAGLSIRAEDYDEFSVAFDAEVRRQLCDHDLQATLLTDGVLAADEFNLDVAQMLRDAGPWGQHFPEPLFDCEFFLIQQRIVGERHLKMVLAVDAAARQTIDAIAFNVDIQQWPAAAVDRVRAIFKLDVNEFRGNTTAQLIVEYLEPIPATALSA